MHELSLAGGIMNIVEEAARREAFARVTLLRLEAGALAGVEVRALRFALEAIAPGTVLAGARIEIDTPPASAWCMPCAATVAITARGQPCPRCGTWQLQATGGDALRIVDMLVDD